MSPAELRAMFGANLRQLAQAYPSISDLSRRLGINRTQFNRYLSGESFPRPDVLARICDFFEVDARVLLEPVNEIQRVTSGLTGPHLNAFLGPAAAHVSEQHLPSGFYQFSRRSFMDNGRFAMGVVRIWRDDNNDCIVRGFEAREAMRQQGLPLTPDLREFRGLAISVENGIAMLISRRRALTCTFNFITRVASFENNFWVGYVGRTVSETPESTRVTRMVYEFLGPRVADALPAARNSGLVEQANVPSFHRHLLQPDTPFH